MNRLFAIFLILVLASVVQARSLESHSITINVDDNGNAKIIEVYTIFLDAATNDFTAFDQVSSEAKNNLTAWQTFMRDIDTSMVGFKDVVISSSKQRSFAAVNLEYTSDNFARVAGVRGRFTEFEIPENRFKFYDLTNDILSIPSKTTLWITFSKDYQILETKPTPSLGPYVENNAVYRIGWLGPLPTSDFLVRYQQEKTLSESFDLTRIASFFTDNPIYGIALLIIIGLVVIYRRQIIGLISESFTGEEEIETPKKELK